DIPGQGGPGGPEELGRGGILKGKKGPPVSRSADHWRLDRSVDNNRVCVLNPEEHAVLIDVSDAPPIGGLSEERVRADEADAAGDLIRRIQIEREGFERLFRAGSTPRNVSVCDRVARRKLESEPTEQGC